MEQAGNVTNTVVEKSGPSTRRESLETGFSTFEKNSTLIPTSSDLHLARRTPREGLEYNTSINSFQIGTGASRSRNKTLDLVTWFGLPQTEALVDEFHCALRKKVLLQGRLYIFKHHICFSSNVFGYVKKKVIPFSQLRAFKKKTHFRFPNSIELEYGDAGHPARMFLTSFLSREEAFRLLEQQYKASSRLSDTGGVPERVSNGGATDTDTLSDRGGLHGGARVGDDTGSRGNSALGRRSGSMVAHEDEGDDDTEEEEDTGMWVVEAAAAPPQHSGCKPVVHAVLPGTPKDFFDNILADSSAFLEDFLDGQGNRRINISNWKRHEQLGHVRDLQFNAPIKGAFGNWGVSHAACYQSHRFCLYQGEHIVFESSQTMSGIPYGDCFTVDLRWDVKADPAAEPGQPQVLFDVHIRVPFLRRCLFKAVIESGSFKQVQETYTAFSEHSRAVLHEKVASRSAVNLRSPSGHKPDGSLPASQSQRTLPGMPGSGNGGLTTASSMRQAALMSASGIRHGSFSMRQGAMARTTSVNMNTEGTFQHLDSPIAHRKGGMLHAFLGCIGDGMQAGIDWGLDRAMALSTSYTSRESRVLFGVMCAMLVFNMVMLCSMLLRAAPNAPAVAYTQSPAGAAALLEAPYWQARLSSLQSELGLLQGRLEVVSREMSAVVQHLTAQAASAVSGGGVNAAAPATPGTEL